MLRGAIEMLGRSTVAHRLNVPYALLDDWLDDSRTMPAWKLSMLLDLIEAENVAAPTPSRQAEPQSMVLAEGKSPDVALSP
jgi:hypothetical protein